MRTEAQKIEALRHALGVYRRTITEGQHCQSQGFHLAVANDAAHTLARHTDEPVPERGPTAHQKSTVRDALREVYRELAFVAHQGGFQSFRVRQARRKAAELLGITYEQYRRAIA